MLKSVHFFFEHPSLVNNTHPGYCGIPGLLTVLLVSLSFVVSLPTTTWGESFTGSAISSAALTLEKHAGVLVVQIHIHVLKKPARGIRTFIISYGNALPLELFGPA
jgi:hypothetical protein